MDLGGRAQWFAGVGLTVAVVIVGALAADRATPSTPDEVSLKPPPTTLPSPMPRYGSRPAEATVDESYSWDLMLTGVPLREAPRRDAPTTGEVHHTDRLAIRCWTLGEEVTNGWPDRTYDDATEYVSDRWWYVTDLGQEGFISDVWLGRTDGDTLGTDPCPDQAERP